MAELTEGHLRVARTARFFVCGDPSGAAELWFVLHGYRQLAERFIRRFTGLAGLAEGRRAVIAPEALNRFYIEQERTGPHGPGSRVGAGWMTREDREHEIADYLAYLDGLRARLAGAAARVVVLGFSQGAETASRWATLGGAAAPDELVLWGGGLAADLAPDVLAPRLAATRVRFVAGNADAWAKDRADAGVAVLGAAGIPAERIDYHGGHRVEPEVLARHWP